ncbi:MAG: PAS domain-containing protein [Deltaproteobacteria bacterium]|nr:MAG: PAS domain-containing protein [Deltaproteobacteria bacterium]
MGIRAPGHRRITADGEPSWPARCPTSLRTVPQGARLSCSLEPARTPAGCYRPRDAVRSQTGKQRALTPGGADERLPVAEVPVPLAVLDHAGRLGAANGALASLLGLDDAELSGRPWLEFLQGARSRTRFVGCFRKVLERGEGAVGVTEIDVRGPGGVPVPVEVRLRAAGDGRVVLTAERLEHPVDRRGDLERALADSLGALDQGAVLLDASGRVVEANRAAEQLLGRLDPGTSFLERLPPTDVDAVAQVLSLGGAGAARLEVEVARDEGDPVPVELSVAVGPGPAAPALLLVRDLRESRRQAFEAEVAGQVDRALLESSDPRRAVLDACTAVARAFEADAVDAIVRVGNRIERWSADADGPRAVGSVPNVPDVPERWRTGPAIARIVGDDLSPWLGRDGGAAVHGVRIAMTAPAGRVGYLFVRYRMEPEWSDRDLRFLARLAGQIAYGVANGVLALETRALAEYREMLLDQSSVLIVSLDADGRIVTWNRAGERLLGVAVSEAIGRVFGRDVAQVVSPAAFEAAQARMRAEGSCALEAVVLDADGHEVPLHLEGRALAGGEGVAASVWVGLDLRARRKLEAQVLRSQKLAAVGVLAAGIAHEINNPLSGVVGYAQLLVERDDLPEDVRIRLRRILDSARRCQRIVEGVLLFSRKRGTGDFASVDVRDVVDRVVRLGEYQWRMRNARIVRDPDESVVVRGDADRLEQVVLNLVANAVDAMPRGGTVRVGVRTEGDRAVVEVQDAGVGIDPDVLPRIFDPFFSTKDVGKGTGLGLAISYGIVEEHGGTIQVESKPGEGTRFAVLLPRAEGAEDAHEQRATGPEEAPPKTS